MALFGFLRADEDEEKRRTKQGGVKNRLFNFIDDTLDVAEGVPEKAKQAGVFARDLGVSIARSVPRTVATVGQTGIDKGEREAGNAILRSADELRKLSYDERKKALQENEGLALVLKNKGVTDPTDENLDKLKGDTKQKTEEKSKKGFTPGNKVEKFLLGSENVQSYQTRREGYEQSLEEGTYTGSGVVGGKDVAKKAAMPLSFLGIGATIGMDSPGGNVSKNVSKKVFQKTKNTIKGKKGLVEETGEQVPDATSSIGQAAAPTPDMVSTEVASTGPKIPGEEFRQRGFLKTVQESDATAPELKQKAAEVDPQTYEVKHNVDLVNRAREVVDTDYGAALQRVKAPGMATDEDITIGHELISKAQRENRWDDAVELVDVLDKKLRESGRAVQAASIYSRLSPEGMLRFAQKEIRQAKEKRGFIDKLFDKNDPQFTPELAKGITDKMKVAENLPGGRVGDEAQILRQQLEGGAGKGTPNVNQAIKDSLSALGKGADEAEGVATKVAKKVERAITPTKKKAVDNLVNELATKINKEILELPGKPKTSPTTIIQEVLKRNKEAQEAWPEVKEILREKFADNPKGLAVLDKFFESELGLPNTSNTINRAITEQLTGKEVKIGQIITESLSKQRDVVDDVTKSLIGEGVDPATAKAFAEDVSKRLGGRMDEAKTKALERMMQGMPEPAKPTIIEKLNKLSNLGALDNKDYIDLARAKLNLPELDANTAKKLSEISQKLQDTPNQAEALTREALELINDQIPIGFSEKFDAFRYQNLLSNPRTQARNLAGNLFNAMVTRPATIATKASTDWFAATLFGKERQAYLKEVPEYYKGMFNSLADATEAMKQAWKGEVPIGNPDLKTLRAMRSQKNMPKALTVVPRMMEAQDKFLTTMIASGEYAAQKAKGLTDDAAKKAAQEVAEYSLYRNLSDPTNATGQGVLLSKMDQLTDLVTKFGQDHNWFRWFVPFVKTPMNVSKQMIEYSPLGVATLKGSTHKTEQLTKVMMGTTLSMIGAKMALDGSTTWDAPKDEKERQLFYESGKRPYSIKVGDTWVPMIYFGPFALAFALPAAAKDANNDAPMDASTMERVAASVQNSAKFFSQQTYLQGMANVIDVISGEGDANLANSLGFTAGQAIPLQGLQRYVAGVLDPTFRQADGFFESIQKDIPFASKSLDPYTDLSGEESKRNTSDFIAPYTLGMDKAEGEDKAVRTASSEFLKTMRKTSRARTKANDQINEALAAQDYAKAQKIAASYNDKLKEAFKPWVKKHGQYATEFMAEDYNQQKIRLNRASMAQRRYNMRRKVMEERSLINR